MQAKTVAQIKAHWPLVQLLVIVGSIFVSGWGVRAAVSDEITRQVQASELRADKRIGAIQKDVRQIRDVLLRGIRLQTSDGRIVEHD